MIQKKIIPDGWIMKSLSEVAPLQRGFDLPNSQIKKGPYPIVYSNGILNYHAKWMCKAPGLITGRSGTIGKFTYIEDGFYWPHNTSLWVTSFKDNIPLFIKYLFETVSFESYSTGTGVPTLNRNDLHTCPLILPKDKTEQQNIASALSSIDKLIDDLGRTIQKKQRIREGAMEELLSGKKRLPGFTEEWVENTFDELFKPYSTASYSRDDMIEGDVLCIHYGDIHTKYGPVVYLDSNEIPTITKEQAGRYTRLKDGDIIMADASEDHEGIGKCIAVITCGKEAIAGLHTILLRPKTNDLFDHRFTSYILSHRSTKKQIEYLSEGTKVNSISFNKIKAVTVTYPSSLKEQGTIADILTSMDDEISLLESERAKYEQIRSGMMEELLTGKKRLK